MRKCFFLFFLLTTLGWTIKADDQVSFKASAPQSVVMGEQFRLTFVVNAEGKDLRVQEMPDFEVLMGPSQSTSYSNSWINGKSSSQTTVSYTYSPINFLGGCYRQQIILSAGATIPDSELNF